MSDFAEDLIVAPELPIAEDAILKPRGPYVTFSGEFFDEEFKKGQQGKILDSFGAGFKQGWGHRPPGFPGKTPEAFKELGFDKPLNEFKKKWTDRFGEDVLRSTAGLLAYQMYGTLETAAAAIDIAAVRAPMGAIYGLLNTAVEGVGLPRDVAGLVEAFPGGRLTGLPTRVGPTRQVLERQLEDARRLGVIGEGTVGEARQAFAPEGVERPTERVIERGVETPERVAEAPVENPPQAADIHQIARMLAPDTFKVYDELASRQEVLRRWLEELDVPRKETPQVKELQRIIDETLSKVRGVEERLTKRQAERVREARAELQDRLMTDTPEMARVRKDLLSTDIEMRDLAPEVSEAYREAERLQPVEVVETTSAQSFVQQLVVAAREPDGKIFVGKPGQVHADLVPDTAAAEMGFADATGKFLTRDEALRTLAPEEQSALKVKDSLDAADYKLNVQKNKIIELSQRRQTIARDVERQLTEAGQPADVARASAAIVQAHYEARTARFNGALGRAGDLYEAEGPQIVREIGGARRGSLNLAANIVRLFRNSDASTFMHETGHSWLEELRRDAQHEKAPADLKADFQTVKDWLGAGTDTLTRAQHEKFARGFERYLMEGQAPTSKLAKVFEQFKEWLTSIYQSVARLRAPITDDIRGVYDRLLSAPSREPVIVPERKGAIDFATAAEETARTTNAADAVGAADNILAERGRVAELLSKAVDDARRDARRGPQRVQLPEREGAGGESASTRTRTPSPDDAIDTGRNPPTGKSEPPRSAAEPFDPADGPLVDKEGNIRVDNLNVPEDVAAAIRVAAEESGGFVEARRGVLSDIEVRELADDLGMSPRRLDRRRIGEAFNAEEIVQARRLLVRSAAEVRDAMGKAATGNVDGLIAYAIARERHIMIQAQVAGITAEAGRALRAFKQLEGFKEAEGLGEFFQRNLKKTPEALQREAQMGLRLDTPGQLNKFVREQSASGWQHMLVEGWLSSLLSGPFTHIRNMIGNTTVVFNTIAETGVAAGVSKVLRHTEGREFAEMGDRIWGLGQGSIDGVRAFGKALVDEQYALERETRIDDRAFRRAIPDVNIGGVNVPVGQAIRLPLRLLAAEDEFFKAVAYRQELNVLARRSARFEGLEGEALNARMVELILDPTEEMMVGATRFAEYQTFTNQLGPQGRALQQWADTHPFARFVFPFIRTPTNIVKYAGERTPFGLASRRIRDEIMGRHGEARQADAIARMALGTMEMTAIGVLAYNELITGGGPTRPEDQARWQQEGKTPYSIRIGNSWISYRGLDPLSFPLAIAADLAEVARGVNKDDSEYQKVAAMAVVNLVGHDMVEKLPLRTLVSAIMAAFEPEQHGQRFINQLAGTLVPGLVAQTAQIGDPVQRETRTLLNALKARVGMRGGLMPRRDVWGEPVAQTDVGPVQVSAATNDPVRLEISRLGMGMGKAQRKMDNVELIPQQYDDYVRISGRFTKAMLDDLIDQPVYTSLTDGLKREFIRDLIETGRAQGKMEVMMGSVGTDNDIVAKGIEESLKGIR